MISDLIHRLFERFGQPSASDETRQAPAAEDDHGLDDEPLVGGEPLVGLEPERLGGEPVGRIIAYKRAYLIAEVDRHTRELCGIRFSSYTSTTTYREGEPARCNRKQPHAAPDPDCSCGYYALKEPGPIVHRTFDGGLARTYPVSSHVLTVALYGTVLEGEMGYRSSHQRTVEITLEGNCYRCHGPATKLAARGVKVATTKDAELWLLDAVCDECAASGPKAAVVEADDIERLVGTSVRFSDPETPKEAKLRRWRWLWTPSTSPLYSLLLLGGAAGSGAALHRLAEGGVAGISGRTFAGAVCIVAAQAALMLRYRALISRSDRRAIAYLWGMAAAAAVAGGAFFVTLLLSAVT